VNSAPRTGLSRPVDYSIDDLAHSRVDDLLVDEIRTMIDLVDGRGQCTELLPRLPGRDEWGYPIARDGCREPTIPRSALPQAHNAVDLCHRLVLSMITDQKVTVDRKRGPAS
jgi:ferredoxin